MDIFRKTKLGMNTSNWIGIREDQIGSIDVKLDRLCEDLGIFKKISKWTSRTADRFSEDLVIKQFSGRSGLGLAGLGLG